MGRSNVSLAEVMGSKAATSGSSMRLSNLADILGDAMPEMPKNGVGRHRLVRALQQRFGSNWRSLPGVKDLVKEFDRSVDMENKIKSISAIKAKGK